MVRRFRLRRKRKRVLRRFRLRGERKRVLRRFRLRRKREGRQRGRIPTHAVEAEAAKWASVVAPTAVKRVDIGVDAQSLTALPSEWASKPTQSTVIDIGGDIDAAILTTPHYEFWWWTQSSLLKASILVVGAGGLGSPALLYLAACGVGRLGIVDHDVVELNNLHRQIPLVSGATIGLEGQLTVYNYNGGPCYRCLFPTPPPTTACQRCSDSGVLGIVPGIIGCHQALEAIKIASDVGEPLSRRMLLFDALTTRIRIVKIRGTSSQCEVCGENATFTEKQFQEFDYEKFTQSPLPMTPLKLDLLPTEARISSKEYKERVVRGEPHALVDARLPEISSALKREEEHASAASLYVVCRRGNDSQRAVDYLHKMGFTSAKDIIGGLESWAHDVDPNFPTY
ncbi:unnamed protein product [Camellia sinensis]